MSDTALPDNRTFLVCDPLHHNEYVTEQQGVLKGDEGGWMTVRDPNTVAEIREKEPWSIIREYERTPGNNQAARVVWTVPEMPWKVKQEPKVEPTDG